MLTLWVIKKYTIATTFLLVWALIDLLLNNLKYEQQNNGESAQQIVIHSLYRNTEQKVFYIIDINILEYTTKTSNNKHLFTWM